MLNKNRFDCIFSVGYAEILMFDVHLPTPYLFLDSLKTECNKHRQEYVCYYGTAATRLWAELSFRMLVYRSPWQFPCTMTQLFRHTMQQDNMHLLLIAVAHRIIHMRSTNCGNDSQFCKSKTRTIKIFENWKNKNCFTSLDCMFVFVCLCIVQVVAHHQDLLSQATGIETLDG